MEMNSSLGQFPHWVSTTGDDWEREGDDGHGLSGTTAEGVVAEVDRDEGG